MDHAQLLSITYSDRETVCRPLSDGFIFTIRNRAWRGGDVVVLFHAGRFRVRFAGMNESFGRDYGAVVEWIDALLDGELLVFEIYSHGEYVLGGSRDIADVELDRDLTAFLASLAQGDRILLAELLALRARGDCTCRLRAFSPEHNRFIILS